jgi:hypothetical protein
MAIESLTYNDLGFALAISWGDIKEADAEVNRFSNSSNRLSTGSRAPYLADAATAKSKAAYLA